MANETFDALGILTGSVSAVTLIDNGSTPNRVLDDSVAFDLTVSWDVAPANIAVLLTGTWNVKAFVESIGPGPEVKVGDVDIAANGGPTYDATITVTPGTIPANTGNDAGLYQVAVVITYRTSLGVLTEIAGFNTGPTFLVRQP